jgi:hypothetical protein
MNTGGFTTVRLIAVFAIFAITPAIHLDKNFAVVAATITERGITSPCTISGIWGSRQGAA